MKTELILSLTTKMPFSVTASQKWRKQQSRSALAGQDRKNFAENREENTGFDYQGGTSVQI